MSRNLGRERASASELRPGDAIWTADGEPAVIQEIEFGDAAYIFTTMGTFRRFSKTAPRRPQQSSAPTSPETHKSPPARAL